MATQDKQQEQAPEQGLERKTGESTPVRSGGYGMGPFSLMRKLSEEMDRAFGGFFTPGVFRGLGETAFWPEVEVQQDGSKLYVQADLPGLNKEDVTLEVRDDTLLISGERKSESKAKGPGYYQTERSYGSFRRAIPLPKGAKPETASATFENGVLKIEMEAPGEEEAKTRKIEVREGSTH